ncbi:MAG: hypothetical protein Q9169_004842 [Polycauliona sp. 2 TL-2023]
MAPSIGYVEDSAAESDYDFDAESEREIASTSSSIEELIPRRAEERPNVPQDKNYPTYSMLLEEAQDTYGEERPPFASISVTRGLNRVDRTRGGNLYCRWLGVREDFDKKAFLVPYGKNTTITKASPSAMGTPKVAIVIPQRPTVTTASGMPHPRRVCRESIDRTRGKIARKGSYSLNENINQKKDQTGLRQKSKAIGNHLETTTSMRSAQSRLRPKPYARSTRPAALVPTSSQGSAQTPRTKQSTAPVLSRLKTEAKPVSDGKKTNMEELDVRYMHSVGTRELFD